MTPEHVTARIADLSGRIADALPKEVSHDPYFAHALIASAVLCSRIDGVTKTPRDLHALIDAWWRYFDAYELLKTAEVK